jgi:hypothetical protein
MPLKIVQMTSDQARALVCCAEKGFQAGRISLIHRISGDFAVGAMNAA